MKCVNEVGAGRAYEEANGPIDAIHHCSAIAMHRFGILLGGEVVLKRGRKKRIGPWWRSARDLR